MKIHIFPRHITAGLTLRHLVVQAAYPAPDWQLSAVLRGPAVIDLYAQAEGPNHVFRVDAALTAQWLSGQYALSLRALGNGEVIELDSGMVEIRPDLSQVAAGHDARDHVRRALDAIEAVIEKRASVDQERYRINNRELWRTPIGDLLKLRDRYRSELARQERARRGELFSNARVVFR